MSHKVHSWADADMDYRIFYWLPFFGAGASIFAIAGYTWLRRRVPGARWLAATCLASSWWSICEGLLYFGFDTQTNLRITQLQYLGLVWVAPLTLLFVLKLFSQRDWSRPGHYLPVFLIPSAVLVLAWSNSSHGLIWSRYWTIDTENFPMLGLEHGFMFWVFIAYNYLCLLAATIVLVRQALFSAQIFRGQASVVLVAMLVTWTGNLVYILGLSPVRNVDPTPLTFSVTAAIMAWGFFRFQLLSVAPVAKEAVFNGMLDGVVVLDRLQRIVDLNPAGAEIIGLPRDQAVGRPAAAVFPDHPWLFGRDAVHDLNLVEFHLNRNGEEKTYDLRISRLRSRRGRTLGRLMVWRDISQRKKLEVELQRLASIDTLTGALNRRSFFERGAAELAKARRYGRSLTALMLDIDNFKHINDCFGHHAGDMALTDFARAVQKELREGDLLGRLGGEEFSILLSETDLSRAVLVAERLRLAVAALTLESDGQAFGFTVSIGVAGLIGEADEELEEVIKRVDRALYAAKEQGRNRVVVCES